MKKLQQEKILHHDKISGLVLVALVILVGIFSAGRVFVANRLVETSESLRQSDILVTKIEEENQKLAEEIRLKESITAIEDRAKVNGFAPANNYAYLSPDPQVAYNLETQVR